MQTRVEEKKKISIFSHFYVTNLVPAPCPSFSKRKHYIVGRRSGFSSISLHSIWRNPVFWQYCLHTSPQSCKVHFNATIPNPNDLWLLLFSGVSDEFRKFLEMGLNGLLVLQFLSTNMGVVVIFQKIVLNSNSIQSWMLRWCGNRKHCWAWGSVSDFYFPGIFVFCLKHPKV